MSGFFDVFDIKNVHSSNFDAAISADENKNKLICVFLWGVDCPNCDVAKQAMMLRKSELDSFSINWYHANIYEDFELATRFGLFGIPVFLFFFNGKKLGKISPFPGFDSFHAALDNLIRSLPK